MNILLYYVIILIREYKFIFTRYRGNSGTPHPDLPSCEYSAFCVYQLIGGLLLWNCLSPFFSSSAV